MGSSPQRRKGRKEIVFYLAVRGRQIKRFLSLKTGTLSSAKAVYGVNNLFLTGWGL
jgi:hypothetical protein